MGNTQLQGSVFRSKKEEFLQPSTKLGSFIRRAVVDVAAARRFPTPGSARWLFRHGAQMESPKTSLRKGDHQGNLGSRYFLSNENDNSCVWGPRHGGFPKI